MNVLNESFDDFSSFASRYLFPDSNSYTFRDCIFRGESSDNFSLIPSALRPENKSKLPIPNAIFNDPRFNDSEFAQVYSEFILLKRFYVYANNNGLRIPFVKCFEKSYLDRMGQDVFNMLELRTWMTEEVMHLASIAQHYGICTRLLDWTQDIFVALYFAATGAIKRKQSGKHSDDEKMVMWALNADIVTNMSISNKLPMRLFVPSYSENPNLNSQKGILSIWNITLPPCYEKGKLNIHVNPVDRTPLDKLLVDFPLHDAGFNVLYRITLPCSECSKIYSYLAKIGYNASRLFPGYDGIVKQIEEEKMQRMW